MKMLREHSFQGCALRMTGHRVVLSALAVLELLLAAEATQLRHDRDTGVQTSGQQQSSGQQFFNYGYSKHGQEWTVGSCSSRSRQSPINLPPTAPVTGIFHYKYNPIQETVEVMNNGHTISVDLAGLGYGGITYENAYWNLMNMNVHSYSEHTWNGQHKPLELHLVHKRHDGDALLVVAVGLEGSTPLAPVPALLQLNTSSRVNLRKQLPTAPLPSNTMYVAPPPSEPFFNPTLQVFLKMEPPPANMKVAVAADRAHSFDLNTFLVGSTFYEYAGSLTAPPCAETVTWLVRKDAVKASDRQIFYLRSLISTITAGMGNYRSLMPVNGRIINMRQGISEELPLTVAPNAKLDAPQQSDRENRAMQMAKDAMTIARTATNYVKDLDFRLRNAAQAHANALAPQLEPVTVQGQVVDPAVAMKKAKDAAAQMKTMSSKNHMLGPLEMEKTARTMAQTLAEEAHKEVEDAAVTINLQAKQAAMEAAREAAKMVASGSGDVNVLANVVSTPAPQVPPLQPAAPPLQIVPR